MPAPHITGSARVTDFISLTSASQSFRVASSAMPARNPVTLPAPGLVFSSAIGTCSGKVPHQLSRLTTHDSRLTPHDSRLTTHVFIRRFLPGLFAIISELPQQIPSEVYSAPAWHNRLRLIRWHSQYQFLSGYNKISDLH